MNIKPQTVYIPTEDSINSLLIKNELNGYKCRVEEKEFICLTKQELMDLLSKAFSAGCLFEQGESESWGSLISIQAIKSQIRNKQKNNS